MTSIDYEHAKNLHTYTGAMAALRYILEYSQPASLLDVGAGTGTWLKAAMDAGIWDVQG